MWFTCTPRYMVSLCLTILHLLYSSCSLRAPRETFRYLISRVDIVFESQPRDLSSSFLHKHKRIPPCLLRVCSCYFAWKRAGISQRESEYTRAMLTKHNVRHTELWYTTWAWDCLTCPRHTLTLQLQFFWPSLNYAIGVNIQEALSFPSKARGRHNINKSRVPKQAICAMHTNSVTCVSLASVDLLTHSAADTSPWLLSRSHVYGPTEYRTGIITCSLVKGVLGLTQGAVYSLLPIEHVAPLPVSFAHNTPHLFGHCLLSRITRACLQCVPLS